MVIFLPILNFFKFHVKGERSITFDKNFILNLKHMQLIEMCMFTTLAVVE